MRHEGVARVIATLPPTLTGRDCLPQATHMAHVTHHTHSDQVTICDIDSDITKYQNITEVLIKGNRHPNNFQPFSSTLGGSNPVGQTQP